MSYLYNCLNQFIHRLEASSSLCVPATVQTPASLHKTTRNYQTEYRGNLLRGVNNVDEPIQFPSDRVMIPHQQPPGSDSPENEFQGVILKKYL